MLNTIIPYSIRQNAFKYVQENNISKLNKLLDKYPNLIHERLLADKDNSTLLIRACKYLRKDIIKLLLDKGANPTDTDNQGNNSIMKLFYRHDRFIENIKKHDEQAIEVLKLLKEKNISLDCFVAQNADKDTPLIEAVRAALPQSTNFILDYLYQLHYLTG